MSLDLVPSKYFFKYLILPSIAGTSITFLNSSSSPRILISLAYASLCLTSDSANGVLNGDTQTSGEATYFAKGLLDNIQETIIATRNADVIRTSVRDNRVTTQTSTRDAVVGWWDPLAQSVMPQAEGGEYLTKIDTFFGGKDENISVTCQIREMQNGYPTTRVLPFGSKTLEPSQVNVSNDATAVTTFVFDSPVYVRNGVEVAIVLQTDSD